MHTLLFRMHKLIKIKKNSLQTGIHIPCILCLKKCFISPISQDLWDVFNRRNRRLMIAIVWFFATTWTAACQASLSFTVSQSLFKHRSIELVTSSHHLILCHPVLLLSSIISSSSQQMELQLQHQSFWVFRVDSCL